jgi:hypothetical protein
MCSCTVLNTDVGGKLTKGAGRTRRPHPNREIRPSVSSQAIHAKPSTGCSGTMPMSPGGQQTLNTLNLMIQIH